MSRRLDGIPVAADLPVAAALAALIHQLLASEPSNEELLSLYQALSGALLQVHARFISQIHVTPQTRALTAEEAAEILGIPVRSVYRQAPKWPFTIRPSPGVLRFDSAGLQRWLSSGRKA